MTSEWVSEAQRIAKEAGEKAASEVAHRANVALGWLTQNAPAAAMCVLESIVFRQEMPAPEVQRGYAQGDWARANAETQALAINALLDKARDAALEEASESIERLLPYIKDGVAIDVLRTAASHVRALKGRK